MKRLLAELDRQGLRQRTLIVLTSDHGEALGEHLEPNHGMLLYGCTTDAALIFSCPGLFKRAGRVSDRVVGLVDVRATIEDLLGISPLTPGDGVSLLDPTSDPDRAIYMETRVPLYTAGWSPLFGLRRHEDKYILAPQPEYYRLGDDPHEQGNLYTSSRKVSRELEQQLADLMSRWDAEGDSDGGARAISGEEINRLAALGYVASEGLQASDDLPDPKDMMQVYDLAVRAQRLQARGRYAEALPLAEAAVAESPTFTTAHQVLSHIYQKLGRSEDAVNVLREAVEHNPTSICVKSLATLLMTLERWGEAESVLSQGEALDPHNGELAMLHGDLYAKQGLREEARRSYEHAAEIDNTRLGELARERIARLEKP